VQNKQTPAHHRKSKRRTNTDKESVIGRKPENGT
jgi:hypothetical protein